PQQRHAALRVRRHGENDEVGRLLRQAARRPFDREAVGRGAVDPRAMEGLSDAIDERLLVADDERRVHLDSASTEFPGLPRAARSSRWIAANPTVDPLTTRTLNTAGVSSGFRPSTLRCGAGSRAGGLLAPGGRNSTSVANLAGASLSSVRFRKERW